MANWTTQFLDRIYQKKNLGIDFKNDWDDYKYSLGVKRDKDAIKVTIFIGQLNCAYYRIFAPFMELAKRPDYDIRISCVVSQRDDIDWADVVYFERCTSRTINEEAVRIKKLGKKVLYDTDDYMHGLPLYHIQKRNIENSRYLPDQDQLCELCDAVTVSTDYLKELYSKRYSCPIVVLPNCVRPEDYSCAQKHSFDSPNIYIGWGGSSTHFEDLKLVTPALIRHFKETRNLILLTLNYNGVESTPYKDAFEGIPMDRRIHIGGTEPHLVPNIIQMIDVGVAPLLDNDFNRAKSNVKYLEYAMCGVPMVLSDLEPYWEDREYVSLALDGDWYDAIEKKLELLAIPYEHRRIEEIKQRTIEKYDIENNIDKWDFFLKGLFKK